jgi:hypothetical protein
MQRTTIVAPEQLMQRLRAIAAEERVSLASVIREALEDKAARHRPKLTFLGIGASGYTDTARRAGDEPPEPDAWR